MKTTLAKYKEKLKKFHQNEDGIEALQVVLIIAVAAILLVGIFQIVKWALGWGKEKIDDMKDESDIDKPEFG